MVALAPTERIRKNIFIDNHRTSISLESLFWSALVEICRRESVDLDGLCSRIVARRRPADSMSSAIRVVSLLYFQLLAEANRKTLGTLADGEGKPADIAVPRGILRRALKAYVDI